MTPDELELRTAVECDDADPSGYESQDGCSLLMEYFLNQLGLPAPPHFLCLSVEFAEGRKSLAKLYGERSFSLKPDYLDKVDIVCAGDFLTVMEQGLHAYLTEDVPLEQSKQFFTLLTGMTREEKLQALCDAHNFPHRKGTYAEVRIFHPFELEWFTERDLLPVVTENSDDFDLDI